MTDSTYTWCADKIRLAPLEALLVFKTKAGEFGTKDIKQMLKYLEDKDFTGRIPWKEVRYGVTLEKAKAIVIDTANQPQGKNHLVQAFLHYSGETIIQVIYDDVQDDAEHVTVKKEAEATKFPVIVKYKE